MKQINVGIIGTGWCGGIRAVTSSRSPWVKDLHIAEIKPERLKEVQDLTNPKTANIDYHPIIADKSIDAVLIGAPDHWHKTMTLDAVAAGKDVYVEKPVSHTIAEGAEMVKVIEASKQIVQTGTQQRSWEHYIQGKEIVQSGVGVPKAAEPLMSLLNKYSARKTSN